ncbi:hypothetical protein D3C83_85960 [compost metagenome]
MEQTDRNVEIMSKAILDHSIKFNEITAVIKNLNEENNSMREDQGIMLKELLAISKRVSKLEDKA